MISFGLRLVMAIGAMAMTFVHAHAAGTGGCDSFEFPLATELTWMQAGDAVEAASGGSLEAPPAKAIALQLSPSVGFAFAAPPTGKPKNKTEAAFAALISVTITEPGLYQVSLSGPGWIDAIQNGVPLKSSAHTGKSDCDGLRKSVRFDVAAGPLTVQLSDVPAAKIRVTIRKAD